MSDATIEERLAKLEEQVAELNARTQQLIRLGPSPEPPIFDTKSIKLNENVTKEIARALKEIKEMQK